MHAYFLNVYKRISILVSLFKHIMIWNEYLAHNYGIWSYLIFYCCLLKKSFSYYFHLFDYVAMIWIPENPSF